MPKNKEAEVESDEAIKQREMIKGQMDDFNDLFTSTDLAKPVHDPEDEKGGKVESIEEVLGQGEEALRGEKGEETVSTEEEDEEEVGDDESEVGEGDEESQEEKEEGEETEQEDGEVEEEAAEGEEEKSELEVLREQNQSLMVALNEQAKGASPIPIVQAPPTPSPVQEAPPVTPTTPQPEISEEEWEEIRDDPKKFSNFLADRDARAAQSKALKDAGDRATLGVLDAFFAQDGNGDVSVLRDLVIFDARKIEAQDIDRPLDEVLLEAAKGVREKFKLAQAAQESGTRQVKVPRNKGGRVRGKFANGTKTRRATRSKGKGEKKKAAVADEIEDLLPPKR